MTPRDAGPFCLVVNAHQRLWSRLSLCQLAPPLACDWNYNTRLIPFVAEADVPHGIILRYLIADWRKTFLGRYIQRQEHHPPWLMGRVNYQKKL